MTAKSLLGISYFPESNQGAGKTLAFTQNNQCLAKNAKM
jgi:hypothetical protein